MKISAPRRLTEAQIIPRIRSIENTNDHYKIILRTGNNNKSKKPIK